MKYSIVYILLALMTTTNIAYAEDSVWDISNVSYAGAKDITVYRDPNCGCCKTWIKHLNKHGFKVTDKVTKNMAGVKNHFGVLKDLASCHTATVGGYVIEGHVPADDIKKLLNTRPNIVGLTVPKMVTGSPGMEMGTKKKPFTVVKFDKSGSVGTFSEYLSY